MRLSFRPSTWPLQLKVPMLVAGLMIAVSIVLSHMVLRRLAQDQETHLHQLTGSYLDGLSTAVLPYVIRRDVWETFDILDRARDRYTGVKARYAVVALKDGSVLAASDPKQFPVGRPLPRQLAGHMGSSQELVLDEKQGLAWVSRVVRQENIDLGSIIAEIDISDLLRVRREVLLALILANGAVTLLFAAVGYALARRMVRPISLLTSYVDRVRDGAVLPIPHQHVADQATEFGRLFASFNDMAAALREREALTLRLAEEEKVAMLGKLASGMAHEVNNPLGGMLNLVDTLRKHGHDQQVRLRSLDLLERGLIGIRNVVRATLTTYKQDAPSSKLLRSELDDLQFLIQHEMSRHRASLRWTNVLPEQINVDGAAVRQIALNLLLNACAASPADGVVEVEACSDEESLMLIIRDQGPGLPANAIDYYSRSSFAEQPPPNVGLGIWTVCLLVSRLGGRIEVVSNRQDGTIIRVVLPLHGETRLAVA